MRTEVSVRIKHQDTIRRLSNLYKFAIPLALKFYDIKSTSDIKEKQFAEFVNITPEFWQHIIHGRRNFSDTRRNDVENHIGLENGSLDKSVTTSLPDNLWSCVFAISDTAQKNKVKLSADKIEYIAKKVLSDYDLTGVIDLDNVESLVLLSK